MGITYRTDGAWGPGKGSDLAPGEVDGNFWQLVQDVAAKAVQGVGIANFQVIGDQMTVVLTDHMLLGPYTLPVVQITFRGVWLPLVQYYTNDIITHGGTTYIVLANHVSASTFDPGANNGFGQDYYSILLQSPACTLPTGGAPGMVLAKATTADFSTLWEWLTFAGLSDVDQANSPHNGDLVYWNGAEFSYLPQTGVTSAPQTLAGLSDVLASPVPNTGDLVFWTGTAFSYEPSSAITGSVTLVGLSDVQASPSPNDGQVVTWSNGAGAFIYATPAVPGSSTLSGLSDVTTATLLNNDTLTWDATASTWKNKPATYFYSFGFTGTQTLALSQQSSLLDSTAGAVTVSIPAHATTAFPAHAFFGVRQSNSQPATIAGASGVTLMLPPGRTAQTRAYGSVIWVQQSPTTDTWELYGDLAYSTPPAMPTTGNFSVDPRLNDQDVFAWTPAGNQTVSVTSGAVQTSKRMTFVITTSGTTSYTLTFGTGFKAQGSLTTGTVSGKVFAVTFVGDGTNFNEISRTAAM